MRVPGRAQTTNHASNRLAIVLAVQALAIIGGLSVVLFPIHSRLQWLTRERIVTQNLAESHRLAHATDAVSRNVDTSEPTWHQAVQSLITTTQFPANARVLAFTADDRVIANTGALTHADNSVLDASIAVDGHTTEVNQTPRNATIISTQPDGTWIFAHRLPNGGLLTIQQDEAYIATALRQSARMMLGWSFAGLVIMMTLAGIFVHRVVRREHRSLEARNNDLAVTLDHRLQQGLSARAALILGLAKLADYRDTDTGSHLERICAYCEVLAKQLKPRHREINDTWIAHLLPAASLHDIGKVGVPDAVLLKAGKLTVAERKLVERHTYMGADTLIAIREELGDDELIDLAIQIALCHHERWDGSGYPLGLKEESIPLAARIVAIADVYDALTSRRVYKSALTHEKACELIRDMSGSHFDPEIVEIFLASRDEFDRIRNKMQPFGDLVDAAHAKAA